MRIYIPTYKRVGLQKTLAALSPQLRKITWLVVRPEEKHAHEHPHILVEKHPGVPAARQCALEHAYEANHTVCVMLDDDLKFAHRGVTWTPDTPKLNPSVASDVARAIGFMRDSVLDYGYAMFGFDARSGNNRKPEKDTESPARVMRAFAVHTKTLMREKIRFDKFPFWEDFHVGLSLLERGYKIGNFLNMTTDAGTNTKGGVSTYRTAAKLAACLKDFQKLHPTIRPVLKKPKSWGGELGQREEGIPDMVVYWKKAQTLGLEGT